MTRWLVNTFPAWALAVLVIGGYVALGVLFHRLTVRRFPSIHERGNVTMARSLITPISGLFGVLLAFTVFGLNNDLKAAQQNVDREAAELAEIYRDSRLFPEHARIRIDAAIIEYVAIVARLEWPAMEEGESHPEAEERVTTLYEAVQSFEPDPGTQSVYYSEVVGELDTWLQARRIRISDAQQGLPGPHLLLLVAGGLVLTVFLVVFASEAPWIQTAQTSLVVALIGFNILVLLLLNHPFSGDFAVTPEPFRQGVLGELLTGAAPS